ncbi:MAG: DEAD/DEAH box helicase [Rhodocyclaceae bacterium]|nr:DEAD/DEAH box helicase [Rhodocyclaceae bacterium]
MSHASYTLTDITRWLGEKEVAKGRAYRNAVFSLEVRPGWIAARVQGSAHQPYQVRIHLWKEVGGHAAMENACTCPVGSYCKHVAATLLAALPQMGRGGADPVLAAWLEEFRQELQPKVVAPSKEVLAYTLHKSPGQNDWVVALFKARRNAAGGLGGLDPWANVEAALVKAPRFVSEDDLIVLRLLWAQRPRHGYYGTAYLSALPLAGAQGDEALERMIASERLYFPKEPVGRIKGDELGAPLCPGGAREARLDWKIGPDGLLRPTLAAGRTETLFASGFWYLDREAGQIGRLQVEGKPNVLKRLLTVPPLRPDQAHAFSAALTELVPDLPTPDANLAESLEVLEVAPQPVLTLGTLYGVYAGRYRDYPWGRIDFDYALPSFHYDEFVFAEGDAREFVTDDEGGTVRVRRDMEAETAFLKGLAAYSLSKAPDFSMNVASAQPQLRLYGLAQEEAWQEFMREAVPDLREAGWEVDIPSGFRHHRVVVDDWDLEVEEGVGGWFDLDLGIEVGGDRLQLAPLLTALFERDSRWLDSRRLRAIPDQESITLETDDGVLIAIPAERLKPLVLTLIDLFDSPSSDGRLRVSRLDALRLASLEDRRQFKGMDAVRSMAEKLRASGGVQVVAPPAGLALELRPYQSAGLAWLQYLREQNLSGILADDMGLGKTAQALAHILAEKEAGRLDRPVLAVMPTSLIHNWKSEAARFAPGLSVLALQGLERKKRFGDIASHDLVLTTYPLLWRDEEALTLHEYHMLILDEAQTVKNAGSRGAAVVRGIDARHRLCLTGTPLENHLGELWTQFDFLLPGFLGDAKDFTRRWRTPVEKHGDSLRGEVLSKRIRPFILRRSKEEVAKELPPKTLILQSVELEGKQRDLYETVRSAMDKKVRDAVAMKGFARSQIVILDALLKLRQVCCDPRLLKSAVAQRLRESAKLDLLRDMLPEMVDEGRRILLFSQFTSMLDLIQAELQSLGLAFVRLDGDTKDREDPIRRFQAGEVPIFLISLKAGGVGLNLTAADTVIHYDPWWNPAVENQATDRAHRIGQDKPVFVYKLIVAGSIEEKILGLQEKKANLADGILSKDGAKAVKFSESDLAALLAPLE